MRRLAPTSLPTLVALARRPSATRARRGPARRRAGTGGPAAWLVVLLVAVLAVAGCSSDGGDGEATGTTARPAGSSSSAADADAGGDGPEAGDPDAEAGPVTVVVLGSSTAAGFGLADPADGWVARYAAALDDADPGNEVVNLAVSGSSTFHVLPTGTPPTEGRPVVDPEHNITAALALGPDAVIVNLPSNDTAMGVAADDQMANLATIVDAAAAEDVPVWVATTQPRNLDDAGRAVQKDVCDRILATYDDRAVDVWTGIAEPGGRIDPAFDGGDGTHLGPAGHALLAERFLAADIPAAAAA